MKKISGVLLINIMFMAGASAQSNTVWNGKKCAVVLTYEHYMENKKNFCFYLR